MEINSPVLPISPCRICLQDGATYSIFDDSTDHSIHSQLNKCFVEKVEDLEGYPRNICSSCKIILDMLCEFIDKYRESCKILKESLVQVKTEVDCSFTDYDDDFVWEEEKRIEIKIENNIQNQNISEASKIIEKLKPKPGLKITKVEKEKSVKEIRKLNRKKRNNEIAISILESELEWNGEKWCLKKEMSKDTIKRPSKQRGKTEVRKKIKVKDRDQKRIKVKDKQKSPVLCDYCGAVFNIKNKLRDHIEVHHVSMPITCNICSKTYPSEKRLKEHTRRFHGDMKLKCEHCTSMFATRSVLNSHIKNVHNKHLKPKKTYSCKFCDKKYKCPASIVVHERTVHTGLLPCVCKVCDKAFSHDMYLRQHMRLHTGELPFLCPICERGYTQLSNMKSHLRIHKMSELNEDIMKKINPNYLKLLKNC